MRFSSAPTSWIKIGIGSPTLLSHEPAVIDIYIYIYFKIDAAIAMATWDAMLQVEYSCSQLCLIVDSIVQCYALYANKSPRNFFETSTHFVKIALLYWQR